MSVAVYDAVDISSIVPQNTKHSMVIPLSFVDTGPVKIPTPFCGEFKSPACRCEPGRTSNIQKYISILPITAANIENVIFLSPSYATTSVKGLYTCDWKL